MTESLSIFYDLSDLFFDENLPKIGDLPDLLLFINFALAFLLGCPASGNSGLERLAFWSFYVGSAILIGRKSRSRAQAKAHADFYAECKSNVRAVNKRASDLWESIMAGEADATLNPLNLEDRARMLVDHATRAARREQKIAERVFNFGLAYSLATWIIPLTSDDDVFGAAAIRATALFFPVASFALLSGRSVYCRCLEKLYEDYTALVSQAYQTSNPAPAIADYLLLDPEEDAEDYSERMWGA